MGTFVIVWSEILLILYLFTLIILYVKSLIIIIQFSKFKVLVKASKGAISYTNNINILQ